MVEKLEHPWGMAFLPDGRLLITQRAGEMLLVDFEISKPNIVQGLPDIMADGQGGLLDVALHPDFAENQWVYFSYVADDEEWNIGTEVARGKLIEGQLTDLETLFVLTPKSGGTRHFGSRLVFDQQGYLYITLGDRGERERSQNLQDHAGSVIRLHDDGRIPKDNPFVNRSDVKPEIYSYGHRNIQGAALNSQTGQLWTHEHGPQGGDEVNVIKAGANYGWPIISYGDEYGSGEPVGENTHKVGMEQPVHHWSPLSIAPSGMLFYEGSMFPEWQGNLFIGSLKDQMLVRLVIDNNNVIEEEHLFKETFGRIRDVAVGLDSAIYLLTDEDEGQLIRLKPNH
jgi:glucose/arabinose dehydrogenase